MNAVSKVQVFDSKNRESEITGIDNGKREERVNIKLKKEYKNSWFGKFDTGVGAPNRYKVSGGLNKFNERHQIGLIVSSNNLNIQDLSQQQFKEFTGRNNLEPSNLALYSILSLPSSLNNYDLDQLSSTSGDLGQSKSTATGINYNYQYLKTKWFTTFHFNSIREHLINLELLKSYSFLIFV